jgi:hypothetical protein
MDPTTLRNKITVYQQRAAALRTIVAQQEAEYQSDTEEMTDLDFVESQICHWKTYLAFLELYMGLPTAAKEDDDVATVWKTIHSKFDNVLRRPDSLFLQSAHSLFTKRDPAIRAFARGLVDTQNRATNQILPREFMHDVVRLGLMNVSRSLDSGYH